MPVTFTPAPTDARAMLDDLLSTKFDGIRASGANVELLFAVGGGEKPALKRFGHAAPGRVEKIDPKARRTNPNDVRLVVDSEAWMNPDRKRREALLHGLLCSLELLRNKNTGEIKRDDDDRPLFRILPGDWLATGFERTLREYGEASREFQGFKALREIVRQLSFAWTDDAAEPDAPPTSGDMIRAAKGEANGNRPFRVGGESGEDDPDDPSEGE